MVEFSPSFSPVRHIRFGGTSKTGANFFGTGASGIVDTSGNLTLGTGNDDSTGFVVDYNQLTVNAGHTLTLSGRRRYFLIYVKGNCVINGDITMNTGASG